MITKTNSVGMNVLKIPIQCKKCGEYDYSPCDGTEQSLADQIAHLEGVDRVNEWIPCEVRVPSDEESSVGGRFREFLVTTVTDEGVIDLSTATFRHGKWFDIEYGYTLEDSGYWTTVAWRFQPEPWDPHQSRIL